MNCKLDGTCNTIKANYYKVSIANFIRTGTSYGATGILEVKKCTKLK